MARFEWYKTEWLIVTTKMRTFYFNWQRTCAGDKWADEKVDRLMGVEGVWCNSYYVCVATALTLTLRGTVWLARLSLYNGCFYTINKVLFIVMWPSLITIPGKTFGPF
jgi:hypothetical protein